MGVECWNDRGYLASGISTKISEGLFMLSSGTVFTTDYNTFIWIVILKTLGLANRDDVWFFIHGDDLNIIAKNKSTLDKVVKRILNLGIADQDEWDTRLSFYLGLCKPPEIIKDDQLYDYAHPVGFKLNTDDPEHSEPAQKYKVYPGRHTFDEQTVVAELYVGSIMGDGLLSYFGDTEARGRSHEGVKTYAIEQAIKRHKLPEAEFPHLTDILN
jgi:hypothetical protein